MPTYEYQCSSCNHRFEVKQSFADPPVSSCPQCNASARRLFHAPAILFKGSGFHATDNRPSGWSEEGREREGAGASASASGEEYDFPEPYPGGHW